MWGKTPGCAATIGLDIGSTVVRAVALRAARGEWVLVAAGHARLPESGEDLETARDATTESAVTAEVLDGLGLGRTSVVVALPGREVVVKRLPVPTALRKELVAAGRGAIADRVATVAQAGHRPVVIDVEGFALANAFELNYPDRVEPGVLLVHVGRQSAIICVLDHSDLVAMSEVPAVPAEGAFAAAVRRTVEESQTERSLGAIGRIFLSGGGYERAGLTERLASEFSAPVESFDPLRRVRQLPRSVGANLVGPPFAVAVGLALRRKGD